MRAFVLESTHLTGMDRGFGNGYVILPKGHPMHGKGYDDIDVDVHGGLTFASSADEITWDKLTEKDKGAWIIGFDTAHWGDSRTNWPDEETVLKEAERLMAQL